MEAHPRRDGTGTAASRSGRGRREQPQPLQPAQRAGSFPLPGKRGDGESHPGGTHSLVAGQLSGSVSSAGSGSLPSDGRERWNVPPPKCGGTHGKLMETFAPPAALEPIRGSVSQGGGHTKVVAGKLLASLGPERLFGLVSPEDLFQKLANIGKQKPKEITAICFPRGGGGVLGE